MPDGVFEIPDAYQIIKTVEETELVAEYIALHKPDEARVRLRVFNFAQATPTARRQLREYLRCDITFMEAIEKPGVITVFDYSDTKRTFWLATQPGDAEKLSTRFDFLGSQSFQFRKDLVSQFLDTLKQIHTSGIIHRSLSSDAVFLGSDLKIHIGDFGFATYLTEPSTARDVTMVQTIGYQPPEVRDAKTFSCDVTSDVFSAGLLACEILFAAQLPKDDANKTSETLKKRLTEQIALESITADTSKVILTAVEPSLQKRWSSIEIFADELEKSFGGKDAPPKPKTKPVFTSESATIAIQPESASAPMSEDVTMPIDATTDFTPQTAAGEEKPEERTPTGITPQDASHEIWNNHYEIIEKIGEGGQAVVYKAYDHLTHEEVAIKTIWSHQRHDRAATNRLKQGAMVARSLTHRYIIKTYSVEQRIDTGADQFVFICMELIKSQTELADVIEERRTAEKKFSLQETLHIVGQLLDALAYAHEHTIHRDIKPGNIMLVPRQDETGKDTSDLTKFNIRLIDFGIAKVLSQKHIDVTGQGFRSAHYGAPELSDARGGVDARADVFSAGVILYQMLTKNLPAKGSPPANKANKEVSAALAKVIDRSINADKEKRFKTAAEFAKQIEIATSRFNWVRKAAKIAAGFIIFAGIAFAVKYFIPKPDILSVQDSIAKLQGRLANEEIAELAGLDAVKYSDIEGYAAYNQLGLEALNNLQVIEETGNDTFKRTYPKWQAQEKSWNEISPAVAKIETIAVGRSQFTAEKDLLVADHLANLAPSNVIIGGVIDKTNKAESLLAAARPFSKEILKICATTYGLAARVYTNIKNLAEGDNSVQTAERINNKLINLSSQRERLIPARDTLVEIAKFKQYNFHEQTELGLSKADEYLRSFELKSAEKYLMLLNQICGTLTNVKDQINFNRGNIALITSRLLQLCNEDIETFQNYPGWQEKLNDVYRRKDVVAKYRMIQNFLERNLKNTPPKIYDLASAAFTSYQQDDLDTATKNLTDARGEYKTFIRSRIVTLTADCDSLAAIAAAAELSRQKTALEELSARTDEPAWPMADFLDDFTRSEAEIKTIKDAARTKLTQQMQSLKNSIVTSAGKIDTKIFQQSNLIAGYVNTAKKYDSDEIDTAISNWQLVENIDRLSAIVTRAESIDSHLTEMLTRKNQLDELADGIVSAADLCERFKDIMPQEAEKYTRLGAQLEQLKPKLTSNISGTVLIDCDSDTYSFEYEKINNDYLEIRGQLPYHRICVIELINKTESLSENAKFLNSAAAVFAGITGDLGLARLEADFANIQKELKAVKDEVDNWPADEFNRKMQDKCKTVTTAGKAQAKVANSYILAIINKKVELIDGIDLLQTRVTDILSDRDITELNELAAADKSKPLETFRQLPKTLANSKQKLNTVVLTGTEQDTVISFTDFKIDNWFKGFNTQQRALDAQISQLQSVKSAGPLFAKTSQILTNQSSIEIGFYTGLRDFSASRIDYSSLSGEIEAIESNSSIVTMCRFLEQINDKTIPGLTSLKNSVAAVGKRLSELKNRQLALLTEIKTFNANRIELLDTIAKIQKNINKLDETNIEKTCKQAVTSGVNQITELLQTGDIDRLKNLSSALWSFFPTHKDWQQFSGFLNLYHVTALDDTLWLAGDDLSSQLRVVNQKGGNLTIEEIASDSANLFKMASGSDFGWPHYLAPQKDTSVVLAFIPHGTGPFYMAAREINNAQYKLFLEDFGARPSVKLAGWSFFSDQAGNPLISQTKGQYPPCRIKWDKTANAFTLEDEYRLDPIVWVTASGAFGYANWLGGKLPTTDQYAHAARGGSDSSAAKADTHIRGKSWQTAAKQYNSKRDNPTEIAYPPVGAINVFVRGDAIETGDIASGGNDVYPVWPCFTKTSSPNGWGLYDMVGNAWEWCQDEDSAAVICGGSSLSPTEYAGPEARHKFDKQACDVGLRIVIKVK